jgi:1-acyl-sn-glycerol-3-phosphate acyltransferase
MSRAAYRVGHMVTAPTAKLLWRHTVSGTENIPRTGGVILASNHLSFIDSFAIPIVAPRPVSFLAKSEYFTGSGVVGAVRRGFFEAIESIPVDRHSSRAAQESLDSALAVLRAGRAFGIYPEGTRSRDGRLYKGRTGVAWLALTAGVPVVPVGLRGTDEVQPIGRSFPRLGAHVTVRFGTPIRPEAYAEMPAGKARRLLTDAVMDAIAGLSGQERADTFNELPPESTGAAVGI